MFVFFLKETFRSCKGHKSINNRFYVSIATHIWKSSKCICEIIASLLYCFP